MKLSAVRGIGLLFVISSALASAFQVEVKDPGPSFLDKLTPASFERRSSAAAPDRSTPERHREVQYPTLLSHSRVEMIIDTRGDPFSVNASPALPDDVVRSLSRWRFEPAKKNGQPAFFDVVMIVPLPSPLTPAAERALRRVWNPMPTEDEGRLLNRASAASLEEAILSSAKEWTSLIPLLDYAVEGADVTPEEARRIRARHLAWLVENIPEAQILASPLAVIQRSGPLADDAAYSKVRELWLKHLAQESVSAATLNHAVNFLRIANPELCEERLLAELDFINPSGEWLGEMYGLALLGVTELHPKTGLPSAAGASMPYDGFARKAAAALNATPNVRVVLSAMQSLMTGARALTLAGKLPAGYAAVCGGLLARTRSLFPGTSATCDTTVAVPDPQQPDTAVRVGGNIQAARLLKKVAPEYPFDARARGIQGTVRFNATIGIDGTVRQLSLLSGPLALYESARAAVQKWAFKPMTQNNRPTEMVTVIEVDYTLSR